MSIEVTWLGHSTVVLDLDGVRIVAALLELVLRPTIRGVTHQG